MRPGRRWSLSGLLAGLIAASELALAGCDAVLPGGGPTPAATATSLPVPRPTAESPSVVNTWYQAALGEGEVRVYADLSPQETEDVARLFGQRFPNIRVNWTRGLDRELVGRILAAARDGPDFDVFVGDAGTLLRTVGVAERWTPPEARSVRPEYVDREGAWYGVAATYHVLQYNTDQVPFAARPTRYEDLANPTYFGRLAVEEDALTWLKGLIESRGRQETVDTLKALAPQGVTLRRGPQTLADLVSAGQHAVAIDNRLEAVERDKRGGAKTNWVAIEPAVVQPTAVVLSARAQHPNAARLFADFLLSGDAQNLLAQGGRIPTRTDIDPEPQSLVRAVRTHFTLPPEGAVERDLRALYQDLWRER